MDVVKSCGFYGDVFSRDADPCPAVAVRAVSVNEEAVWVGRLVFEKELLGFV